MAIRISGAITTVEPENEGGIIGFCSSGMASLAIRGRDLSGLPRVWGTMVNKATVAADPTRADVAAPSTLGTGGKDAEVGPITVEIVCPMGSLLTF